MNRKLSDESLGDIRAKINFLIVDETDAIKEYDNVLNHPELTEGMKLELEEIRNEEIAHIVKLSNLLKRFATGEKSEETSKELGDGLSDKYIVQIGSQFVLKSTGQWWAVPEKERATIFSKKEADEFIQVYGSRIGAQAVKLNDTNYVYETDKPNVKWKIHQSKKGGFYFADPNGSIYEENGKEVWFASKESAGQFFIKKLFNKSLWGNEIPRVVVDSKTVKDSKGFVIGNNSKTEFLRWGNDKYIVAKSPDAATLYPTERSAKIALELSKFDNSKFSLFELDNNYNIKDATGPVFKVGETVKVSQYDGSWKDKIRKVLTREEAEKQFKSIVSGTSNAIKHWYILESGDKPVADFRISPIV